MSAAGAEAEVEVCLVSMPYADLSRPSLALGLLKAALEGQGIPTGVVYPNLWFAERIGADRYELCSKFTPTEFLVGEWTFAAAAFPDAERDDEDFLRRVGAAHYLVFGYNRLAEDADRLVRDVRAIRKQATAFVDAAARRVLASRARIVGCTSTFEQHVSSLALLRRIRELDPTVCTMMGGANCETDMGRTTHRCFPWVDFVVSGEADSLIVELVRGILAHGRELPAAQLPEGCFGPVHRLPAPPARLRALDSRETSPRAVVEDLDLLPTPDFADYFQQLRASPLAAGIQPGLPLETSRGCWWGAVRQCTFCGLNGRGMAYRSKSAERVLAEIHELESRHAISSFETVDNILDMEYFQSLLPRLAAEGGRRKLFYETKANLKRHHVEAMRRAGVIWFQPGIESLRSEVLDLMDKGVHGWQNVQLLKWAREFGLRVSWSFLWDFPGEEDAWYAEMAGWLPLLEHLPAPGAVIRVRYDRYSVFHERAGDFGLRLDAVPAMRSVYPLAPADLRQLAYFFVAAGRVDAFSGGRLDRIDDRPGVLGLRRAAERWRRATTAGLPPVLAMEDDGEETRILDSRACAPVRWRRLTGLGRAIHLACDEAPLRERLPEVLAARGHAAPPEEIAEAVRSLLADRLVLSIDRRLVALAVRGDLPTPPAKSEFPGGHVNLARLQRLQLGNASQIPAP